MNAKEKAEFKQLLVEGLKAGKWYGIVAIVSTILAILVEIATK